MDDKDYENLFEETENSEDVNDAEITGEENNNEAVQQTGETNLVREIFDWLEVLVTAMVVVVIVFSLIFRVATIDGRSMENTLFDGQKVIMTNLGYTPKQGDIVVISRNINNSVADEDRSELPIIKRVIATQGQWVDIDFVKGIVYVDGVALKEDYVKTPTNLQYPDGPDFPVKVKEGCIFVMGDNRNDSLDSRSGRIGENGMIDTHYVLGHAVFRIFPFNKVGGL